MAVACVLFAAHTPVRAQIAMPDAREMSGIPRPVTDLPDRMVSVRLIRGDLSNNITGHPVELHVNGAPETVRTGEDGRAQFGPIPVGARLKAIAEVDGERLESVEFPAPAQGGIRLMLVATDPQRAAAASGRGAAEAIAGEVTLGGETRFVIEGGDEHVRVFYLLDIVNQEQVPVEPAPPFVFDAPTGAQSVTVMEGSSPLASVAGARVRVGGPIPPGTTSVQVGFILPTPRGVAEIDQRFPAPLERVGLLVEKHGDAVLRSPQIERQQDMPIAGRTYITGAGGPIPRGQALEIAVSGLPHHSRIPRDVALGLAGAVLLGGLWLSRRPVTLRAADRKHLVARREQLMQELVRLEARRRQEGSGDARYVSRREALIAALEQVYEALDADVRGLEPAARTGQPA